MRLSEADPSGPGVRAGCPVTRTGAGVRAERDLRFEVQVQVWGGEKGSMLAPWGRGVVEEEQEEEEEEEEEKVTAEIIAW